MAEEDRVFRLRSQALDWVSMDEEIVVLDQQQDLYLSTNQSGAQLWRMLADGATKDQLADQLVETHGISKGRAERDVDTFLDDLISHGLVE